MDRRFALIGSVPHRGRDETIDGDWTLSGANTFTGANSFSGITTFTGDIVAGTADADFDALTATSYGGITEANLLDKTATEAITGAHSFKNAAGIVIFDAGGTDKVTISHNGSKASIVATNATSLDLSNTGGDVTVNTASGSDLRILGGGGLEIFDAGSTDKVAMSHGGTDFLNFYTNTVDVAFDGFTGFLVIGRQDAGFTSAGTSIWQGGKIQVARDSGNLLTLKRIDDDGELVGFFQGATQEGSISVSGTTVTYGGAHLSFKSHLSPPRRIPILRGTVMEYDTYKAEWWLEDEDEEGVREIRNRPGKGLEKKSNDQMMTCKVSNTAGARTVAGVFDIWIDEQKNDTDLFVATTGDYIIRVTGPCEQGDLLESNGDGTARVQADDLVRSSTIAKAVQAFPGIAAGTENPELVPCQLLNG